jgi:hypothetical protein
MQRPAGEGAYLLPRIALGFLVLFLLAVVGALAVTLSTVSPPVQLLASALVLPIVALCLLFLFFERRGRPWSFLGAAALGFLGVALRLVVNSHPQLEVGGGLPLGVTVGYVVLGSLVGVTSLWAFGQMRRTGHGVDRTGLRRRRVQPAGLGGAAQMKKSSVRALESHRKTDRLIA